MHLSNLALISNKYSDNAYWAYHLYFWFEAAEYIDEGLFLD